MWRRRLEEAQIHSKFVGAPNSAAGTGVVPAAANTPCSPMTPGPAQWLGGGLE
eukprot:CAMPEP_0171215880 /NCGR_PEP_ID=MMETSP0790-20130122/31893_1 /TAXON_ID=2925 /ORGANISM="Alexandrium catenella, Strain OF101" /LENGTH=52 /DNA_ID=CAMNT_0011681643 /DNA_START=80 /DNA_END=238 /DNA_ORIENTATION=+